MSSIFHLQKVSENLGAEILNNMNSVKHMLKERLPLNFIHINLKNYCREHIDMDIYLIKFSLHTCHSYSILLS